MKRLILIIVTCSTVFNTYCQTDKKNLVGTHIAFGSGLYGIPFAKGANNNVKYFYSIGLDYVRVLSNHWDLCSGFEYTYTHMTVTYTGLPERTPYKEYLTFLTLPVLLKYHFGKMVYLTGGPVFYLSKKSHDGHYAPYRSYGSGFVFGIGFEHEFSSGVMLSLNPYARWNRMGGGLIGRNHYSFLQGGVSLGIGYKF